jgi:hypothetical protein
MLSKNLIHAATRAAESLGGARLTEPCVGRVVTYPKPKRVQVGTCACGNDGKIALPYEVLPIAAEKGARERGGGIAIFCLFCDLGFAAPRMAKAIKALPPEEGF